MSQSKVKPTHENAAKKLIRITFFYHYFILKPFFFVGWLSLGYDVRRFQYYIFQPKRLIEIANKSRFVWTDSDIAKDL